MYTDAVNLVRVYDALGAIAAASLSGAAWPPTSGATAGPAIKPSASVESSGLGPKVPAGESEGRRAQRPTDHFNPTWDATQAAAGVARLGMAQGADGSQDRRSLAALVNVATSSAVATILHTAGVLSRPYVALRARAHVAAELGRSQRAWSHRVLNGREQSQMLGIDAAPVAADVVDHLARFDRSNEATVGPAMCAEFASYVEPRIALRIDVCKPRPALGIRASLDLRPEQCIGVHVGRL